MDEHSQSFNAANVADAIFASMLIGRGGAVGTIESVSGISSIVGEIEDGLKVAGLSFAEYLDRLRQTQGLAQAHEDKRWRFSARERAVQRVDYAVSQLCMTMQQFGNAEHSPTIVNCNPGYGSTLWR